MQIQLIDIMKKRRSRYGLTKKATLNNQDIEKLIQEVAKHTPSAFNSQSSRMVILFDQAHDDLWDITTKTLKTIVSEEKFVKTQEKMDAFKAGYGTILFFEDLDVVQGLQKKFPLYHENFAIWSQQSAGMVQFAVWTALAENNMGASLQHYNPLIDEAVIKRFNLPKTWELRAQMPFGVANDKPKEKSFVSLEERIKVINL